MIFSRSEGTEHSQKSGLVTPIVRNLGENIATYLNDIVNYFKDIQDISYL